MTDAIPYLMREAGPADVPFVVSGWVREMRHAPWSRHVPNGVYGPSQHELIHRILQTSRAIVACDRDNPELLLGCIVAEWDINPGERQPCVHWIYVKGAYRGIGIGRDLLFSLCNGRPELVLCTQASKLFDDKGVVERYRLVYSPYLLLGIPLPSAATDEAAASEQAHG